MTKKVITTIKNDPNTTIVVIYGRQGVGKTSLLGCILSYLDSYEQLKYIIQKNKLDNKDAGWIYYNLIIRHIENKKVLPSNSDPHNRVIPFLHTETPKKKQTQTQVETEFERHLIFVDISGERMEEITNKNGDNPTRIDPFLNSFLDKYHESNILFINLIDPNIIDKTKETSKPGDKVFFSVYLQYVNFIHLMESVVEKRPEKIKGTLILIAKQELITKNYKSKADRQKELERQYPRLIRRINRDQEANRAKLSINFYDAISVGEANNSDFIYQYEEDSSASIIGKWILEKAPYINKRNNQNEDYKYKLKLGVLITIVIIMSSLTLLIDPIFLPLEIILIIITQLCWKIKEERDTK